MATNYKAAAKRIQKRNDACKARIARAIPYMADRLEQFTVWNNASTWEMRLIFNTGAQAKRFCEEARQLGHEAKMILGIRWRRGGTDGFHKTSREVRVKLDSTKRTPPKPVKPFDPEDVQVYLNLPIDRNIVIAHFSEFPVGVKVTSWLSGKSVDDSGGGGSWDVLKVEKDSITMKCEFATVTMRWDATKQKWHLSFAQRGGGGADEYVKKTNLALWKLLCTAWNVGIRGVIV